jgi:hypothetical protein
MLRNIVVGGPIPYGTDWDRATARRSARTNAILDYCTRNIVMGGPIPYGTDWDRATARRSARTNAILNAILDRVTSLPEMWAVVASHLGFVQTWRLMSVCRASRIGWVIHVALNPQPSTFNPQPSTINPKP